MGSRTLVIKSVVAALLLAAPVLAQDAAPPGLSPRPGAAPDPGPEAAPAPDAPAAEPSEREADLLRQLREAESPYAASLVERQLDALWQSSGSAAIDLLLRRGEDALQAGDATQAIEHFSAAIDWAPDFGAAYSGRAIAFYTTGEAGLALGDIRQALALNPNDWRAMQGFAVLLEEIGEPEDALEVWTRVHDINPQNPEAEQNLDRLTLLTQGRTL